MNLIEKRISLEIGVDVMQFNVSRKIVNSVSVVTIQVLKIGEYVDIMMISKGDSISVSDSTYL